MKAHRYIVLISGLCVVACNDTGTENNVGNSPPAIYVMPEEARIMSDSAFHMHFMKNDSASLEQALSLYYQSLKIDPDNFITLNNIWQLENRLSLYTDALETSRKILRMSNNNDIMCIGMVGAALDHTGDSAQARKYYLWSLEVTENILDTMDVSNPDWITVQMNKAFMHAMLCEQEKADEAIDYLAQNADSAMAKAILENKRKTRRDFLAPPERVQ